MDGIGYAILALAVAFLAVQLSSSRSPTTSSSTPSKSMSRGGAAPAVDSAVITKNPNREYDIGTWHSSWRIPVGGRGAFTFTAHKPRGGLVIGIGSNPNANWHKGSGYGIVLDNTDKEKPRSWVGKFPWFAREMSGSKMNHGYRMRDCEQAYWVIVDGSRIYLGEGSQPGDGQLVLPAHDPVPDAKAMQKPLYFGFGSFGTNMGWGRHVTDATDGVVSNIRLHPVPSSAVLRDTSGDRAHCPNGQLPLKTVPVPFVTQTI